MGIFHLLKSCECPSTLKKLNQFLKFNVRLAEAKTSSDFISDCMDSNEYPKVYWKSLRRSKIFPNSKTLKRHARNQLDSLKTRIAELERNLYQREAFVDNLTINLRSQFLSYVQEVIKTQVNKKKIQLMKSLDNKQSPQCKFPAQPHKYVHNFSKLTLNSKQLEVLSLGPKFCDVKYRTNRLQTELQFESISSQTTDLVYTSTSSLENFKSTLVNCCFQYQNNKYKSQTLLNKEHQETIKQLKNDKSIIITKPDKGSGVVLLDKDEYINKINNLLSDESKFQKLSNNKDLTEKIEQQLTISLKPLLTKKIITTSMFEKFRPSGTTIPRLYGLPKVHKLGIPLRPILDMSNSPYHEMAKWLVRILEPLRRQIAIYSLKDTFEFVEKIKSLNIKDKTMISMDVNSLFTNVPLIETVEYICNLIEETGIKIELPTEKLKELLLRCTMNVQFIFNNQIYRQVDGVAMGSPLGPILADFFMAKLENGPLSNLIKSFSTYFRYIDDTFILCDPDTNIVNLVNQFNDAHQAISFTYEKEDKDTLPFLDVQLIRRPDGTIKRRIYRKKTFTGQYTNFLSFVPLSYKRNLVKTLIYRASKICTADTINEEIEYIENILRENGYPDRFIKKNKPDLVPHEKALLVPKKPIFLKLPFKGDLHTEILSQKLNRALRKTYYAAKLKLTFSTHPNFSPDFKDKQSSLTTSMCIYKFNCSCGASYIGRTTRRLSKRIREHCPSWLGKGEIKSISSSILAHLVDSNHSFDINTSFRVIYKIPSSLPKLTRIHLLRIAEAIAIKLWKPNLCVQKINVQPLTLPWPTT